jgi:hypothetical protein
MQQRSARDRSAYWYKQCLPELFGVKKALAEKRLAVVEPLASASKPEAGAGEGARPEGPAGAASNALEGESPFTKLFEQIPTDMYTLPDNFDSARIRSWLRTKTTGQTLETTGRVFAIGSHQAGTSANGLRIPRALEVSTPTGMVNGVRVIGRLTVQASDNGQPLGIKEGDQVRIRGKIREMRLNPIKGEGGKAPGVIFYCYFSTVDYSKAE